MASTYTQFTHEAVDGPVTGSVCDHCNAFPSAYVNFYSEARHLAEQHNITKLKDIVMFSDVNKTAEMNDMFHQAEELAVKLLSFYDDSIPFRNKPCRTASEEIVYRLGRDRYHFVLALMKDFFIEKDLSILVRILYEGPVLPPMELIDRFLLTVVSVLSTTGNVLEPEISQIELERAKHDDEYMKAVMARIAAEGDDEIIGSFSFDD